MIVPNEGLRAQGDDRGGTLPTVETSPEAVEVQFRELLLDFINDKPCQVERSVTATEHILEPDGDGYLDIVAVYGYRLGQIPSETVKSPLAAPVIKLDVTAMENGVHYRAGSTKAVNVLTGEPNPEPTAEVLEKFLVKLPPSQADWIQRAGTLAAQTDDPLFAAEVGFLVEDPRADVKIIERRTTRQTYQDGTTIVTTIAGPYHRADELSAAELLTQATRVEVRIARQRSGECRYVQEDSARDLELKGEAATHMLAELMQIYVARRQEHLKQAGDPGAMLLPDPGQGIHQKVEPLFLGQLVELIQTVQASGERERTRRPIQEVVQPLSAAAVDAAAKEDSADNSIEAFRRLDKLKYAELNKLLGKTQPCEVVKNESAKLSVSSGEGDSMHFEVGYSENFSRWDPKAPPEHTEGSNLLLCCTLLGQDLTSTNLTMTWGQATTVEAEMAITMQYERLHDKMEEQEHQDVAWWMERAWHSLSGAKNPKQQYRDAQLLLRELPFQGLIQHVTSRTSTGRYKTGNGIRLERSSLQKWNSDTETIPPPTTTLEVANKRYAYTLIFTDHTISTLIKHPLGPTDEAPIDVLKELSAERTNEVLGELLALLEAGIDSGLQVAR